VTRLAANDTARVTHYELLHACHVTTYMKNSSVVLCSDVK
jgi:hypothetical protein